MPENQRSPAIGDGISRRSFLVTVGGTVLGSFFLPEISSGQPAVAAAVEEPMLKRHLLWFPAKMNWSDNDFTLMWVEQVGAERKTLIWRPETDEERAEARRFYDAAHGIGPTDSKGKEATAPIPPRSVREQALIQAILDQPDDDAPCLKYAAWLASQGNPQGEFVRLCCLKKRMPEGLPQRKVIEERCAELIKKHAEKWFEPLAAVGLSPTVFGHFYPEYFLSSRGLIEKVQVFRSGILPENADRLFAAVPLLREISFAYDPVDLPSIFMLPQMKQVTSLHVGSERLDLDTLRVLASSPFLSQLTELDLGGNDIGAEASKMLAAAAFLPRLRTFRLAHCSLDGEGLKALISGLASSELESLDLTSNRLGSEAVLALAEAPIKHLKCLSLGSNPLEGDAIHALQGAQFLEALTSLDLDDCKLGADAARSLAGCSFRQLRSLLMNHNGIAPDGAAALAASPRLQGLQKLELRNAKIQDAGAHALAASPYLRALTHLDLYHNRIGPAGFIAMALSPNANNLQSLALANNAIGSEGAEALASSPYLKELKTLDLESNAIGVEGTLALANSANLKQLTELNLENNPIGLEGANALAESPHLANLTKLAVTQDLIGADGIDLLVRRFGKEVVRAGRSFVVSVALSPDRQTLASGNSDALIRLWDVNTGRNTAVLAGHAHSVGALAFSPDGGTLVSGSNDGAISVWEVNTATNIATRWAHTDRVGALAVSPDGMTLASQSSDKSLRFWDLQTGQHLDAVGSRGEWGHQLVFASDGKTLAALSAKDGIDLWNATTLDWIGGLGGYSTAIYSVAFSPNCQSLAASEYENTIRLLDVATSQSIRVFSGHTGVVSTLAFNSDGKILASGAVDRSVRLWDVETGTNIGALEGHKDHVECVAFSADGLKLISVSQDLTIKLWDVASRECTTVICEPPRAPGGMKKLSKMSFIEMFARIDDLPSKSQSICVCAAATTALPIWEEYEKLHCLPPTGAQLLSAFEGWQIGAVESHDLKACEERLLELLPSDLQSCPDLSAGLAGWSILDVALVALNECGEVQHSIVQSAVLYAAAAVNKSGTRAIWSDIDQISEDEKLFLTDWWVCCCNRVPELRRPGE
jgi:uncharacterized protein (TIGR02996 family)